MWCVCVGLQAFCVFRFNCVFFGAVRCTEGDNIHRHKIIMHITFAAWREVKIEFAKWFLL